MAFSPSDVHLLTLLTGVNMFIAEFLVKFLEQEVCRLNWDVGFVTSTMQEIGVQLPRLLEVYDQLFKTRVHTSDKAFQCRTFALLLNLI